MTALLFDRALLRQRRHRAFHRPKEGSDFLLRRIAEDVALRLQPINRQFDLALDHFSPTDAIARALRESGKVGQVARLFPMPGLFTGQNGLVIAGDDEAPSFAAASFNLITSALSLPMINDVPGMLIQLRRLLKADGLLMAVTFGGATLRELREVLGEAESELYGGVSPRVAPFVDVRDMGSLLQRAGFALPVCDTETVHVRYQHAFDLFRDLRAMAATNVLVERSRRPLGRRFFLRAAELYAARHAGPDGRILASFELVWAMGWAPHESQQKALAPGSARMRLADALRGEQK